MLSYKKLNPIATKLFVRDRKLNISLVFITKTYFAVPKIIRPNSTAYFIMKIPNKQKLQQYPFNHSPEKCTAKPYSFLVSERIFYKEYKT